MYSTIKDRIINLLSPILLFFICIILMFGEFLVSKNILAEETYCGCWSCKWCMADKHTATLDIELLTGRPSYPTRLANLQDCDCLSLTTKDTCPVQAQYQESFDKGFFKMQDGRFMDCMTLPCEELLR